MTDETFVHDNEAEDRRFHQRSDTGWEGTVAGWVFLSNGQIERMQRISKDDLIWLYNEGKPRKYNWSTPDFDNEVDRFRTMSEEERAYLWNDGRGRSHRWKFYTYWYDRIPAEELYKDLDDWDLQP